MSLSYWIALDYDLKNYQYLQELDAYYKAIYEYKKNRHYLPGCPDNYKRVLRKSAVSYTLQNDQLFYTVDGELRYVPMVWKERLYFLASAHMSEKGRCALEHAHTRTHTLSLSFSLSIATLNYGGIPP